MKRTIIAMLTLLMTISLSGCHKNELKDGEIIYINDERPVTPSTTEDVVSDVYDSVVYIDTYVDGSLYGSGSGVLFGYDANLELSYILTCYHVINKGDAFMVGVNDDMYIEAKLVGGDPSNDIALLSVPGLDYTYSNIGDSDTLRLGQSIIVIGNPLGFLPGSVATGCVSYLNREVMSENYRILNLIQTNASINSGNSGGAMFDYGGRLVGIVNAKFVDEGVEGLGFAIPINKVMEITESILSTAKYNESKNDWEKGYYIGAFEFAFSLKSVSTIFGENYVVVSGVTNNESASGYGQFNVGDEIRDLRFTKDNEEVAIDDISDISILYKTLYNSGLEIGDNITFGIIRNREYLEISIELTQFIPS